MKINQIFRTILKKQNLTIVKLANRMGQSQNTIKERLRRENCYTNVAVEIARYLDYKVIIVPASRKLSDDEYEIEPGATVKGLKQ